MIVLTKRMTAGGEKASQREPKRRLHELGPHDSMKRFFSRYPLVDPSVSLDGAKTTLKNQSESKEKELPTRATWLDLEPGFIVPRDVLRHPLLSDSALSF